MRLRNFRRALIAELDYRREASNLVALGTVLESRPAMLVPAPYDDYTTSRVLTMEFVDGRKVTDFTPLARVEVDLRPLADELFGAYLERILRAGLFHADPHAGNLLVTPDNRLALLDVGMVGRLGPDTRRLLARLMVAVMSSRTDDITRIAKLLGTPQDDYDEAKLASAINALMMTMTDGPLADLNVGVTLLELSRSSADAGLRPAHELALLGKTLLNLDAVATCLDPGFESLPTMQRHIPDLMRPNGRNLRLGAGLLDGGQGVCRRTTWATEPRHGRGWQGPLRTPSPGVR